MKQVIVVISANFINAKKVATEINNMIYRDAENVKLALSMLLKKEEDEEVEAPKIFTIDNFLLAINEETIGLDNYFVTKLSLEL